LAYHFLGGVIHNADALCSFFNPTVNSYKRINAPRTISGATWAPNTITYGGNNRSHMVRIPDQGRFELRLMDGAANPYLIQAGVLAAGLDGVLNNRDPGKRLDINMYTEGHTVKNAKKLPLNLLDALRLTDKSKVVRDAFGAGVIDSYIKLKTDEWNSYTRHLTNWERDHTLDC
jgi:glutamine synthetase